MLKASSLNTQVYHSLLSARILPGKVVVDVIGNFVDSSDFSSGDRGDITDRPSNGGSPLKAIYSKILLMLSTKIPPKQPVGP